MKPFSPTVVVADAEIINKILSSKSHLGKTQMYDMLKPFLGDGLAITSKGWLRIFRMNKLSLHRI